MMCYKSQILKATLFYKECALRVNVGGGFKKTYKHTCFRELAGECMGKNNSIITSLVKFQAQKWGKGLCLQVAL